MTYYTCTGVKEGGIKGGICDGLIVLAPGVRHRLNILFHLVHTCSKLTFSLLITDGEGYS